MAIAPPLLHFPFALPTRRRDGATVTRLSDSPNLSARERTAATVRSSSAAMPQAFIPDIASERSRSSSAVVHGFALRRACFMSASLSWPNAPVTSDYGLEVQTFRIDAEMLRFAVDHAAELALAVSYKMR